jgi:ATP-dependent exoDNAse (exonuclease V) alpha subunit
MTAVNGAPASGADLGGLAALPGLKTVTGQIADLIAVLRAEQARRQAGMQIRRQAWKNLVFTGGPGTGKSRAARALARLYKDLGLLIYGQLIEIAAADLAGATPRDTASQVAEVIKPTGDLLLITGAHTWQDLPDRGQHLLSCLYQQMTAAHRDHERLPGELAIILSGRKDPLLALLAASPALAARFPAIIDFPGYTPAQLAAIVTALASEAGLRLTAGAQRKAAAVLAEAEKRHATGNARRAVHLLNQATTSQARRVNTASGRLDPAGLATICADDIPGQLPVEDSPSEQQQPGQYL